MSKEIKAAISRIIDEYEEGTMSLATLEAMILQEIDRAPHPVCVIVPPIEWGEQSHWYQKSKCGKYHLYQRHRGGVARDKWDAYYTGESRRTLRTQIIWDVPKVFVVAACQAHAQATVNRALEGCKIEPFRDPQGLVDALGRISNMPIPWYKDGHPSEKEIAQTALKAWEDGK